VLVGALLVTLFVYYKLTRVAGPEEEAEHFLELLAEGKADRAHAEASRSLRTRQTVAMLSLAAQTWGLNGYDRSSWDEVQVTDREATLSGSVITKDGGIVPLVVKLVREGDQWQVLSVALAPPEANHPKGGESNDRPGDAAPEDP
jgi:hypothetical protein